MSNNCYRSIKGLPNSIKVGKSRIYFKYGISGSFVSKIAYGKLRDLKDIPYWKCYPAKNSEVKYDSYFNVPHSLEEIEQYMLSSPERIMRVDAYPRYSKKQNLLTTIVPEDSYIDFADINTGECLLRFDNFGKILHKSDLLTTSQINYFKRKAFIYNKKTNIWHRLNNYELQFLNTHQLKYDHYDSYREV